MVVNYEGIEIPDAQVKAFRSVLSACWTETLEREPKEWNKVLLEITEGRRSKYSKGKRTFFYSWCGDWVTYHLERAGSRAECLNRDSLSAWLPGLNLSMLRVWAGDPVARRWSRAWLKAQFPKGARAWHRWDNETDACKDGYKPQVGDLVFCPRKNGDHVEFWMKRHDKVVTVCAGAQYGGVARVRDRDLDIEKLVGIIDISQLACSEPY